MAKKKGSAPKGASIKNNTVAVDRPSSWLALIPLMFAVAVVPLIVYLKGYDCGLCKYDFFLPEESYIAQGGSADFFLYWKMVAFSLIAAVMAGIAVYRLFKEGKSIKFTRIFIPLGVYGALAFLSSLFSKYKPYPFRGIYEQFEPVWVLLGYCIVAYYAYMIINTEKDIERLIGALAISTVIMIFIGLTQAFFTDFYKTTLGLHMILPAEVFDANGETGVEFNFEAGRVYMSLYNPNYVGSYVTLLMPVFMMLTFGARRVWEKLCFGIVAVGLIIVLLGGQSRAGFVGLAVALVLVLVFIARNLLKYWFPVAVAVIMIVGTVYTYDNYNNGLIVNKIKSALSPEKTTFNLTDIQTKDDQVVLKYKGNNLHVAFNYDYNTGYYEISPFDDKRESLDSTQSEDGLTLTINDSRFSGITIAPVALSQTLVGFDVKVDGHDWYFANVEGSYYLRTPYGKLVDAKNSASNKWLSERSRYLSGRGFIWSKTLPLLKKYVVFGSGADTFSFVFPNDDFLSLYNGGYEGQVMTKPHNMYLQMGVQTGLLSLLAFLAYCGWFFVYGVSTLFKVKRLDYLPLLGIGILSSTTGYLVVQLINDSSITFAPIYWVFTGLGLAVFTMIRKNSKSEGK